MRMADLTSRAGVSSATVKWYIRIGLLPRGESTARNQARYDERHLHRIRLIRALLEVGGLTVEQTQQVLAAVDDPERGAADVAAAAHAAVSRRVAHQHTAEALPAVDRYLAARKWTVGESSPARADLAAVLAALRLLSGPIGNDDASPAADADADIARLLDPYADALEPLARSEVAGLPPAVHRGELAERIVLGTVLMDQAISALRRLAQENAFTAAADRK
ncbi:MerR family transcriptional regulator [Actinoplanes sp. NPDC024001]|uniref:MerR family transcriptional regulator n=1 Tax=Actinoplanes sp. NPDC024001 TaxID=3154598 RepID=UPI0033C7A010